MNEEDYFKYYIQGTDHYLIPKDVFIELFNEMVNWREEVKELKKQLEEKENIACNWKDSCLENAGKIEKLENQQKDNWNKLKEIVKSQSSLKQKCHNGSLWFEVDELLNKMQELEGDYNE